MTQVFQLREDKALTGFPISYRRAMGLVPRPKHFVRAFS
jgi:hypothetical protein